MQRRHWLALAAAGLGPLAARSASAQETYPNRPLRMIVQFPPGSTPDTLARVSAEHLQARLGQPVVVENRPGAAGNIAAEAVAKSAPDGYTLLLGQNGLAWAPWLFPKLAFDPLALASVSVLAHVPFVLTVRRELAAANAVELVALAKGRPGELVCATSGIGSPHHLLAELFMSRTGTRLQTVPYKGTALIMPDLLEGRVDVLFSAADGVLPHIQSGKVRALAVVGARRLAALPTVPTLTEAGLGVEAGFWIGLYAPPGTPAALTQRLSNELRSLRNDAGRMERLTAAGTEIALSTPDEMNAAMKSDHDKWGPIIKAAKITLE